MMDINEAKTAAIELGQDIAQERGTDQVEPWVHSYAVWDEIVRSLGYAVAYSVAQGAAAVELSRKQDEMIEG